MNKRETWNRLIDLKAVRVKMPERGWNLIGADLRKTDLSEANLSGANLCEANLSGANLRRTIFIESNLCKAKFIDANLIKANLSGADLSGGANLMNALLVAANLSGANLSGANLCEAKLSDTNLSGADLSGANLSGANLRGANLCRANLSGSILENADLVKANFSEAILTDCRVFGVSAWGVTLDGVKDQSNLRVTPVDEPVITVDNLEVAQFVYLLLHNEKIRSIIDTIGTKGVLILGRFVPERKAVLDAIRNKLRQLGFVPMMFDFDRPNQRDFTETIKILAGMSRFIIADITNPKSSPLELQATVPDYMIPLVPIIQENEKPFSMFVDLKNKYPAWVFDVLQYDSPESLVEVIENAIINPALQCAEQLVLNKAQAISMRHVKDYK